MDVSTRQTFRFVRYISVIVYRSCFQPEDTKLYVVMTDLLVGFASKVKRIDALNAIATYTIGPYVRTSKPGELITNECLF